MMTDKKQIGRFTILLCLAYMCSYFTRINFGAIISEMEKSTGIVKSQLSAALTGAFITYGIGQAIIGFVGDRVSPKRIVFLGFVITICMNFLLPFCQRPWQMTAVWCVNGFAQSFMWPPMVKLMAYHLDKKTYDKSMLVVNSGTSLGTLAVYLVSPLIILALSWRHVFWFSGLCAVVMVVLWARFCKDVGKEEFLNKSGDNRLIGGVLETKDRQKPPKRLFVGLIVAIITVGILRDGVTTWMPSFIEETFGLDNKIAILTGVILPIFSIIAYKISLTIYQRKFKSPISCGWVIYAFGGITALALCFVQGKNAVISIILMAILTGSMHGVNLMLISIVPSYFAKMGKVSTVSGLLNAFTYVGSAISTYGVSLIVENSGWGVAIIVWFAVAVIGTLTCILTQKPWNEYVNRV